MWATKERANAIQRGRRPTAGKRTRGHGYGDCGRYAGPSGPTIIWAQAPRSRPPTIAHRRPPPPTATVRRPDQSMAPLCDLRAGHDSTAPSRLAAHASPTATLLPPARAASRAQRSFCHARPPLLAGNYPLERRKARALRRGDWRSPYRRS